jgi:hypothetical protein
VLAGRRREEALWVVLRDWRWRFGRANGKKLPQKIKKMKEEISARSILHGSWG